MLAKANLVVTAWDGELLVGISRALSDFAYVTYLSDLAVRASHQRKGIGQELIHLTQREGGPETSIVLLAAPKAVEYYPHMGFERHDSAWVLRAGSGVPEEVAAGVAFEVKGSLRGGETLETVFQVALSPDVPGAGAETRNQIL